MAYTLYKSNGQKLVAVTDGSIDKTTTDLTFVGKNYAGYGEILNQNMVKLLENFSNNTQPAIPMVGQLWFDSSNKLLKIYNGTRFKSITNFDITTSARPSDNNKGDLWFNEFEQKLYFYNGTKFVLIGPYVSEFAGIGLVPSIALDDNDNNHYVMNFVIEDEANKTIVATMAIDEFTPHASDELTTNDFIRIKRGITLPGANMATGNSTGKDFYFWGTAAHSLNLGDYPASAYFRRTEFDEALNVGLHIKNDYGVFIGSGSTFQLSCDTGASEGKISILTGDTISFNVQSSGETTRVIAIEGKKIVPNYDLGVDLGQTNKPFTNLYVETIYTGGLNASAITGNLIGNTTGTHTGNVIGDITGSVKSTDGTHTLIDSTNNTIGYSTVSIIGSLRGNVTTELIQSAVTGSYTAPGKIRGAWSLEGTSTLKATYADLAEKYHADAEYDVGTVLVVGGPNEVTISTARGDTAVAGIVSINAAYMMNSEAGPDETHRYVALAGRVPCKVVGPVKKGELLVTSAHPGYACSAQSSDNPNAVLGKALEDFVGDFGVIEVKV